MSMTEAGDRHNRPQAPADEPVFCDWDAVGDPECINLVDIHDNTDLCEEHTRQAIEENEAETACKRAKEWT